MRARPDNSSGDRRLQRLLRLASLMLGGGLAFYLAREEETALNAAFVLSATILALALAVLATRRLLWGLVVACAAIAAIVRIAILKRAQDAMVTHSYDLVYYLGSAAGRDWLWRNARGAVLAAGGALALTCLVAAIAFALERPRISRRASACVAVAACLALVLFAGERPERRHTQMFWDGLYVSAFYASFAETAQALWRGRMIEAEAGADAAPLPPGGACAPAQTPPDIILIHEESVVPPALFPALSYDRSVDDFFRSDDGLLHRLRVETYGGASWMTEFSVLSGLSARSFGNMRMYLQTFMRDRLADALPQVLAACGYRNVVYYPAPRSFLSTVKFYESIGFDKVFDSRLQNALSDMERDRFYFGNALTGMEQHIATSSKPLFTFIETMATHWPYDITYRPEVEVPGGGPGTPPEMHEYLRRLSMARIDDDWLRAELARRFPRRAFLIVRYGDHQPVATRTLLGLPAGIEAEDVKLPENSPGFETFYAVNGVGMNSPAPPPWQPLDVAFLGAVLLRAAGLPLPPSWRERETLMAHCGGAWFTCPDRNAVLAFHRRLIDAKLIAP